MSSMWSQGPRGRHRMRPASALATRRDVRTGGRGRPASTCAPPGQSGVIAHHCCQNALASRPSAQGSSGGQNAPRKRSGCTLCRAHRSSDCRRPTREERAASQGSVRGRARPSSRASSRRPRRCSRQSRTGRGRSLCADTYSQLWPDSDDRTRAPIDDVLGSAAECLLTEAAGWARRRPVARAEGPLQRGCGAAEPRK